MELAKEQGKLSLKAHDCHATEAIAPAAELSVQEPKIGTVFPAVAASASTPAIARGTGRAGKTMASYFF